MRRPTRTRRLSIAAMVSLLAFVMLVGAAFQSLSVKGGIFFGDTHALGLAGGCATYYQELALTNASMQPRPFKYSFWGFRAVREQRPGAPTVAYFSIDLPLYVPLLLLLMAPVRWLIARPENAPAFPVVTKQPLPRDTMPLMPDQKPTLEYGRPDPRPHDRPIDVATSIVLAVLMFSMAIAQFCIFFANGILAEPTSAISISLFTSGGLLMMLPAWKQWKRRA